MDYRPFLMKCEGPGGVLWLVSVWADGVEVHSKGLAPARTQGASKNGFANVFIFIPSYPADLWFSYLTGHIGLIKIRFKNYKALEFWKGVGLGYCDCEMIASPTSCISLLSKMDLGRKINKAATTFKITQSELKKHGLPEGTSPKTLCAMYCSRESKQDRKKKISSLSVTYNFVVSNMYKYLWQMLLFS